MVLRINPNNKWRTWVNVCLFLKMGQPRPLFVLYENKLHRKTEHVSGIRTRIVGVEGKHADHLTTTTASFVYFPFFFFVINLQMVLCPIKNKIITQTQWTACSDFEPCAAKWKAQKNPLNACLGVHILYLNGPSVASFLFFGVF